MNNNEVSPALTFFDNASVEMQEEPKSQSRTVFLKKL